MDYGNSGFPEDSRSIAPIIYNSREGKWGRNKTDRPKDSSLGRWVVGSLGRWVVGSLGRWVVGSLGRWVVGSLGRWVVGER